MPGVKVFAIRFVVVVAAFATLLFMRPDARDLPQVIVAPEVAGSLAYDLGVMMATNADDLPVFGLPFVVKVSAPADMPTPDVGNPDAMYRTFAVEAFGALLAVPDPACPVTFAGERRPLALVALVVDAPCLPATRLIVRQGPLELPVQTNASGVARFTVPAMSRKASFALIRDNIELARTDVVVPDLWRFDRVALNWRGAEALNLHALHANADIGSDGHIWRAAPGALENVATGKAGVLFEYHDRAEEMPVHAEVFTFPAGHGVLDGGITLRISNLLHPRNCAREVDLQVVNTIASEGPKVLPLSLRMPDCGQIGYVVLLEKDLSALIADGG